MTEQRGIDGDLISCLENNPQTGSDQAQFAVDDIEKVLAVWEGERDEDDWRWIIQLKPDGEHSELFVALQGSCDYTGWDCQSGAGSTRHATALLALRSLIRDSPIYYGHDNDERVIYYLCRQLIDDKHLTWREKMDKEFGIEAN